MNKENRLRSNIQFRRVYKNGKSYGNRLLVLYICENGLDYNRIGFSVSKKIGNSVKRNSVKRRMREIYRLNCDKLKNGFDLIFLPKVNVRDASYEKIESAMLHLLKISHLIRK